MTPVYDNLAEMAGYQLLEPAIHGGSSTVYKAKRLTGTGTPVALKILHPHHDGARIHREALALRTLEHPHIARFVEVGSMGDHAYLATQWIEGTSLKQLIHEDLLTTERALQISEQVASALHHAHEHNVTHGDLSPSNILISHNKMAVLLDFGTGRITSESTITDSGDLAGTPRYLAPELIKGASPSPASDQYALAMVVYEMLTGGWPFDQRATSAATALHHQLYSAPTPLREARPDCPGKLEKVLTRAFDKHPEKRFPTINAFSAALATSMIEKEPLINAKRLAIAATTAVVGIATTSAALWYPKPEQTGHTAHAAQTAERLCNLYGNADFANELEQNFYRDQNNDSLARRIEHVEIDSSPVMQLGDTDIYGVYGIIIPVNANQSFTFSADLWFEGYVHRAQLAIVWLDSEWQAIEGADSEFEITEKFNDRYEFSDISPPSNAQYAVPSLFKDASKGIAFADNIHFSAVTDATVEC